MNSPIYPVFLTHVPVTQSSFSTFIGSTSNTPLLTQPLSYSAKILYPTFSNYVLSPYTLYQNPISASEGHPETSFCWDIQQWRAGINLSHCSTKGFQSERDSRIDQEQASIALNKEQDKRLNQNSVDEKLAEKKTKKSKPKTKDRNYVPHRNDKKDVRRRQKENENRNIIPNQMNQILSFIEKKVKSGRILERLWAKYPPSQQHYSVSRFYLLQKHLKGKVGQYGTEASFKVFNSLLEPECMIWSEQEQRYYIKLSRALIEHFLREDSIFSILTSKRMKSEKKLEHLKARRVVATLVKNVLKEV